MSKCIIMLGTWDSKPIEWIVLKEENSALFCVSKDILFRHCFNDNEIKSFGIVPLRITKRRE